MGKILGFRVQLPVFMCMFAEKKESGRSAFQITQAKSCKPKTNLPPKPNYPIWGRLNKVHILLNLSIYKVLLNLYASLHQVLRHELHEENKTYKYNRIISFLLPTSSLFFSISHPHPHTRIIKSHSLHLVFNQPFIAQHEPIVLIYTKWWMSSQNRTSQVAIN